MSHKIALLAAALGGAALAGVPMLAFRPGPAPPAHGGQASTDTPGQLQAEKDSLHVTSPAPAQVPMGLVPHATPDEAAAIAAEFLDRPAPTDTDLAALAPFTGTENVPIGHCAASWPEAARADLSLASATPARRLKNEIYAQLNLRQVLETSDCTCAGKVAPFEPVALILAELTNRRGGPTGSLVNELATERRRLQRAIERLCGGSF